MKNLEIQKVISQFLENQSLALIGELRNLGVGLKILKNNKWQRLTRYNLPLKRFIPLYNEQFEITALGVY